MPKELSTLGLRGEAQFQEGIWRGVPEEKVKEFGCFDSL